LYQELQVATAQIVELQESLDSVLRSKTSIEEGVNHVLQDNQRLQRHNDRLLHQCEEYEVELRKWRMQSTVTLSSSSTPATLPSSTHSTFAPTVSNGLLLEDSSLLASVPSHGSDSSTAIALKVTSPIPTLNSPTPPLTAPKASDTLPPRRKLSVGGNAMVIGAPPPAAKNTVTAPSHAGKGEAGGGGHLRKVSFADPAL
jgi:hypothetical protein